MNKYCGEKKTIFYRLYYIFFQFFLNQGVVKIKYLDNQDGEWIPKTTTTRSYNFWHNLIWYANRLYHGYKQNIFCASEWLTKMFQQSVEEKIKLNWQIFGGMQQKHKDREPV